MTTREAADAYIALRAKHNAAEAAEKMLAEYPELTPSLLVDALNAEILSESRPDFQAVSEYRNELLKLFKS